MGYAASSNGHSHAAQGALYNEKILQECRATLTRQTPRKQQNGSGLQSFVDLCHQGRSLDSDLGLGPRFADLLKSFCKRMLPLLIAHACPASFKTVLQLNMCS